MIFAYKEQVAITAFRARFVTGNEMEPKEDEDKRFAELFEKTAGGWLWQRRHFSAS